MQSFRACVRLLQRQNFTFTNTVRLGLSTSYKAASGVGGGGGGELRNPGFNASRETNELIGSVRTFLVQSNPENTYPPPKASKQFGYLLENPILSSIYGRNIIAPLSTRGCTTMRDSVQSMPQGSSMSASDVPKRIKFKRLDKTAKNIMQILDKEAVEEVRAQREIPDIKPGYIVQLKVEVPENKRRVSTVKGIVIARRNAGLNSTFRIRRLVAGVGVESLFPLYSPNLKELKVLDKKKVRRAKLYYLRNKMNALKKQ